MADQEDEIKTSDQEAKTPETNDPVKQITTNTDNEPTRVRKHKGKPVQIDLSKVKTKIKPHNKPNLPNPLTEYGLDEKKQARAKARAERELKEKKQKKSTSFYGEDERDREKERLKDEKYMQVLEDLKMLRNYYYSEYRAMLDTKVEKQRKNMRDKAEAEQKRQQCQEEKEREASHRVKKRHDHHKLQHDENYMKNVPKSDVYLILGLQEKMVKEGKLRCQEDLDRFWLEMRKPDIFFSHFPNGLATTSSIHQKIVSSATTLPEDSMGRSLSQILESKESSRPTTHDTWAVTQRFHHIHQPIDSQQTLHRSLGLSPSKQAALELERRFPKLEMPELHCFTMDLGKKPPDPEEIRMKLDLKMREKQRRQFLKKLRKMHQLAMANSAAATRILDKHTDLAFLMEGPQLTDLISDYYWEDSRPVPQSAPARDHLPPLTECDQGGRGQGVGSSSRERSKGRPTSEVARKRDEPTPVEKQLVVYEPHRALPLTMEEVKGKNRIIEAKILSSYWTNYMHAGKNVFLTSSS